MRLQLVASLCAATMAACAGASNERSYRLQGQVIAVAPARQEATLKHEEIKGFMPAMTMPYKVKDARLLTGIAPGDLVDARLVVVSNDAYLTGLRKVGTAPLETPPVVGDLPAAAAGFELLAPGDDVPDVSFVDQDGRTIHFTSFRGSTVVVTFIYTKCPMPTFCPLMDRHFATLQDKLAQDPVVGGHVRLLSVSFDPATDTPPVLEAHARKLQADPKRWTFVTGDRDEIDRFAARFGVSVARALNDPVNITHNLRTAIVDAKGRLVKVYSGNDWTPEQLLADLR